ncbi:MAG TPA: hypothetical protein DCQ98_19535 [Planctomycetaceae bacterium]|nr:hypothetical protein [Planctomycetaceae bacterium]HRF00833.1 DUF1801 domain-containing protein [Pirellulaceae bacterium]
MSTASPTIDEYLAKLPDASRMALRELLETIRATVPGMEERASRGVPFFRYRNRRVVGFGATARHLSFYIMEGEVLRTHAAELHGLDVSSTVIRFSSAKPLSRRLIRTLVLARIAEIDRALERSTSRSMSEKR